MMYIIINDAGDRLCYDDRWRSFANFGDQPGCVREFKTLPYARRKAHNYAQRLIALPEGMQMNAAGECSEAESGKVHPIKEFVVYPPHRVLKKGDHADPDSSHSEAGRPGEAGPGTGRAEQGGDPAGVQPGAAQPVGRRADRVPETGATAGSVADASPAKEIQVTLPTYVREVRPHARLHRDRETGIAWIEDGTTGLAHSCHPNVSVNGDLEGMRRQYWKDARIMHSHGFYYNVDLLVSSDALDDIARQECCCVACAERWRNEKFQCDRSAVVLLRGLPLITIEFAPHTSIPLSWDLANWYAEKYDFPRKEIRSARCGTVPGPVRGELGELQ